MRQDSAPRQLRQEVVIDVCLQCELRSSFVNQKGMMIASSGDQTPRTHLPAHCVATGEDVTTRGRRAPLQPLHGKGIHIALISPGTASQDRTGTGEAQNDRFQLPEGSAIPCT